MPTDIPDDDWMLCPSSCTADEHANPCPVRQAEESERERKRRERDYAEWFWNQTH